MVNGDTYHVTTRQHYHVQKRSDDAVPSSFQQLPDNSMVIFRDSDLYNPSRFLKAKRGLQAEETTCGSDTMLNKTSAYIEATSSPHEYYYPPDLTSTIPMANFDASSSWTDILATPMSKRGVAIKVAGPNPVPAGCPTNRLVNYMVRVVHPPPLMQCGSRNVVLFLEIFFLMSNSFLLCRCRVLLQTVHMSETMEAPLAPGNRSLQISTRPQESTRARSMSHWA